MPSIRSTRIKPFGFLIPEQLCHLALDKGTRRRTLLKAPLFSHLSPLPVSATLFLMNPFYLWEGGLGDGRLADISLLEELPLCA
jgi:hypothetical protein